MSQTPELMFAVSWPARELLYPYKGWYFLKPYQVLVLESRLRPKRFLGL